IAVLGDTYDATGMIELMTGEGRTCNVLVHEATNAFLPDIDPDTKTSDTYLDAEIRAREHGHSTPEVAGRFARSVGLGMGGAAGEAILVLNHFSSRYKDDEADGV